MATSRTGTARWKRLRSEALAQAQDSGLTHCPCVEDCKHHKGKPCRVPLDYMVSLMPSSAEPDHLHPWKRGGPDIIANVRVVCRRCNQARGSKTLKARTISARAKPTTTSTLVPW